VHLNGEIQLVAPAKPVPPHCPYCATVPGVLVGDAEALVAGFVVVATVVVATVVEGDEGDVGLEAELPYRGGPGMG